VLVVVASRFDRQARSLVDRWADHDARLLTCDDLAAPGWNHHTAAPAHSTAVIGGRIVPIAQIAGVLTRLPSVLDYELSEIRPDDRDYVAAEMTAFLTAWLGGLDCPVLNRPTATCLAGPSWRPEQWAHAAARLGMRVRPVRRRVVPSVDRSPPDSVPPAATVTVVGRRCLGPVAKELAAQARRLADVAGVDLLDVLFSGPEPTATFVGASIWPDLDATGVADAALAYLRQGGGGGA
jgi:hypothetical protein